MKWSLGGDGRVNIVWDRILDANGFPDFNIEYHIYIGPASAGTPTGSTPAVVKAFSESNTEILSLQNGTPVAVAVRAFDLSSSQDDGNETFVISIPGAIRYCDKAAASPGDGTTAAHPLLNISDAIQSVADAGGGSVYVAGGLYAESLKLPGQTAVYGGFDFTFDVANRNPSANATVLDGANISGPIVKNAPLASLCIIDGLTVDGGSLASFGIDISGVDSCVSNTTVRRCVAQGITIQSGATGQNSFEIHRSSVREHFGEGLELIGNLDVRITDCEFAENFNEGVEALPLAAPSGKRARMIVTRSTFHRNSNEGMDIKLAVLNPANPGESAGSKLDVMIDQCTFSENRLTGAKIDIDYVDSDAIESRIIIKNSLSRANALEGFRIDLDAKCIAIITNSRSTANLGAGFYFTGGPAAACLQIAKCTTIGNTGMGVLMEEGPVAASVVNCTFARDLLGTWTTSVGGPTVANSVMYGVNGIGGPEVSTLVIPGLDSFFKNVPASVLRSTAVIFGTANFGTNHPFLPGDRIEIADDGIERTVTGSTANSVDFTPPLATIPLTLEAIVFRIPAGGTTVEDLAPLDIVNIKDLGIAGTFDTDGTAADLGAAGGTTINPTLTPSMLGLIEIQPLSPTPLGSSAPFSLRFDHNLDPLMINSSTVLLLSSTGIPIAASLQAAGETLQIQPLSALGSNTILILGMGLRGTGGERPAAPWVFEY